MKKTLFAFLALALALCLPQAAFAELGDFLSIGSSGRAIWQAAYTSASTDINGNAINGNASGDKVITGLSQTWGDVSPRTTLSFRGETDIVSFSMEIIGDGEDLSLSDNAYIEIRPFPSGWPVQAKILVGGCDINESRDDAMYGMFGWVPVGAVLGEDQRGWIFPDLLDVDGGLSLRLYPIEGLTLGVAVPLDYSELDDDILHSKTMKYVWGTSNAYIAYELPNAIGKIRLGWDGQATYDTADDYTLWGYISAAFDFTMVPGLFVGVGTKIPTTFKDSADSAGDYLKINAYARYSLDISTPLTFHLLVGTRINAWDTNTDRADGFGFQVGLGVDWDVLENVPIFLDVRYANGVYMSQDSASGNDCFTACIGISRRWANAELGVGFGCANNGYAPGWGEFLSGNSWSWTDRADRDFEWTIPVLFAYNF